LLVTAAAVASTACNHDAARERPLVDRLPKRLAGVQLERQAFSGPEWLEARPESFSPYSPPQFRVDARTFLRRLDKRPRDLTVAWAVAPSEGIQVIAYRVRQATARELDDAYLGGLNVRRRTIQVAGRSVALLRDSLPQRGFVYVWRDVIYSANSFHVDGNELEELIAKLPGRGVPPPPLQRLLPAELAGVTLERRLFSGDQWVAASPEQSFQPEVKVALGNLLAGVDAPASALTTAWALGPDGPKVVAYRVTGVPGRSLMRSFIRAVGDVHTTEATIGGKRVTVAEAGVPRRRGYLYVNRDVLVVAGSTHLNTRELQELFARLP
jgi:hypothetical protein